MVDERPIVIVSNRGPVSFALAPDGSVVARRGAGGLVSGLAPLVRNTSTRWIAAAMTEGDRVVAEQGLTEGEGFQVRLIAFDADTWSAHYDDVCNTALWFTHHGLFDPVYAPAWPPGWVDTAWAAYERVNQAFAEAIVADAPQGAAVLVQDYHLCLVAPAVRRARPDLRLVHFSHTPFAPPSWMRLLPQIARQQLLHGLSAFHACGFHTTRWEADFLASCHAEAVAPPVTFVAPLGIDADELRATVAADACQAASGDLEAVVGDRALVVRVDRIELSKNLLRGFDAYAALLEGEPERRGRVVFGAFVYPSRQGVADYDRYARAVRERVQAINDRFGTEDWTPVLYDETDDYPRSIAALGRADVVMVNPIRDGLNLVAKEAVVVNDRQAQLVLSPEAGAWEELREGAWGADPFDVGATAAALAAALDVDPDERTRRSGLLRDAALARTSAQWLADQRAAAD